MSLTEEATDIVAKVIKSAEMINSMLEAKQHIPLDFIQAHNVLVSKEQKVLDRIIANSYIAEGSIASYNKGL